MTGNSTGLEIPNLSFEAVQLRWEITFTWANSKIGYVGCGSVKKKKKRSEKIKHHQIFLYMGKAK